MRTQLVHGRQVARVASGFGLLLSIGAVAHGTDWVELGPAPISASSYTGRVSAIACSRTDPDRYFAAGADGGVWRTTDGGTSWTPLTSNMPTSAMGALAIDPTNESVIYAGTGEGNYANHSRYGLGLYKSTDGGDTWQVLAADVFAGRCFSKIVIHPQNTQRLYASITRAGGFPELAAAKGHPGARGPVGVFRSDDGGASWTQLLNGLPNLSATDVSMDALSPSVLYAAIGHIFGSSDNGVYKTVDGGDSWSKLGGGLPTAEVGRISVAVAPTLSTRVYALFSHLSDASGGGAGAIGAYRSDDGGETWSTLAAVGSLQATYGWYLSFVGVHPSNADSVYVGGLDMYRSTAGGTSWSVVTPPHVDMHAIAWDAGGRLVVGDDGGVHRSANGGGGWEARNNGLGVIQCYAGLSTHTTNDGKMFVGAQDNGTLRLDNGAWTQVLGGDGGWTSLAPSSPWYVYAEYQGSNNLYQSWTGGNQFVFAATGIETGDRNCFEPPHSIDPTNELNLLHATHRIQSTTDRAAHWASISGDLTGGGSAAIRSLARAPSDPNTVYVATNDGRILRSTDGAKNFDLILENVPGWPRITRELFVHPSDPNTLYLAVAYFGEVKIRRTRDGGQTWEALGTALPDIPVNVVAVDVRGPWPVIYAGTDAGLYRSVDDGASWIRFGHGLPNVPVIDLRLEPTRNRMIAATQGRGVWKIAVGLPGDMNCDGMANGGDADHFIQALFDPDLYIADHDGDPYPPCDIANGDFNGDGVVNGQDIDGFVKFILGP